MKFWVFDRRFGGPVELLEHTVARGTVLLFMGGQTLRNVAYACDSKGFSSFTDDEKRVVNFFADEGYHVLTLRGPKTYRWRDKWVDKLCTWTAKNFPPPHFLIGHSAGAILAQSQLANAKPAITNIALLSNPYNLPIRSHVKPPDINLLLIYGQHDPFAKNYVTIPYYSYNVTIIPNVAHDVWSSTETLNALKQWMTEV